MDFNNNLIDSVEFAKALADETRQRIMAICCCVWVSVNDIVDELNVSQPTVSHHLKILKEVKLVNSERRGKQVYYRLNQKRLAESCCKVSERFAPDSPVMIRPDLSE